MLTSGMVCQAVPALGACEGLALSCATFSSNKDLDVCTLASKDVAASDAVDPNSLPQ